MNYNYITDFHKSREARIGASDIPWLIPHPEKQIESLAAYTDDKGKRHPCTALDLYNDKINGKDFEYSFPAEMGHYLEGRALYEFIKDNIDYSIATDFLHGYNLHKIEQDYASYRDKKKVCLNPEPYNNTPFKHNTEFIIDYGVAHADCLYVGNMGKDNQFSDENFKKLSRSHIIKKNGLTIDLSKPALIEAKSANYFSVKARQKDIYKGYDLELKEWQGIPLATYFQVQFQMWLYKVDVCYLTLIYNTNSKHYWQIKANKKHQKEIVQLASYMKKCIDSKTPPKKLVMNSKDIISLYPKIKDDFRETKGKELSKILEISKERHIASTREKLWKREKEDCDERMSIHLKDTEMLKGIVNGELQTVAKWKKTGGGLYVQGLKDIGYREDSKKIIRYLEKNEMIKEKNKSRKPEVKIKLSELEEMENGI